MISIHKNYVCLFVVGMSSRFYLSNSSNISRVSRQITTTDYPPLIRDHTPLIVTNHTWSPPTVYDSSFDKYLIYESELNEGLSTPLIENTCPMSAKVVIMVSSSVNHRDRRDAIRQTWAKLAKSLDMAVFFVMGVKPKEPSLFQKILNYFKMVRTTKI